MRLNSEVLNVARGALSPWSMRAPPAPSKAPRRPGERGPAHAQKASRSVTLELLLSSMVQGLFTSKGEILRFRARSVSGTLLWSSATFERNCPMSMHSHLAELERRHKALDKEIESEKLNLAADDLHIVELKRKKLLLKDQIEKLRMRSDEPERTLH
jgi:hypothetical protein